jgi:hypothetical protein
MGRVYRKQDIRISSTELFVYYHKKLGLMSNDIRVGGCTNKKLLSEKSGVDYYILMREFTRKDRCYYETEDIVILKLLTDDIKKGKQSVNRKGRGGMENFVKYIMKKDGSY